MIKKPEQQRRSARGTASDEVHAYYREPKAHQGLPCFRELRIPVSTVVEMLAQGMTEKEILEALLFAAEAVRERELPLVTSS